MGVKGDRESGRGGGDRSVSVKDETPKQVSKRQTDRQTEYIKYGGRGDEHLHQTQHSRGQRTLERAAGCHTFILAAIPELNKTKQLFLIPYFQK